MTENSNGGKKQREKERLLVEMVEGKLGREKQRNVKERETKGSIFSITAHTDNKDPDFKRL